MTGPNEVTMRTLYDIVRKLDDRLVETLAQPVWEREAGLVEQLTVLRDQTPKTIATNEALWLDAGDKPKVR